MRDPGPNARQLTASCGMFLVAPRREAPVLHLFICSSCHSRSIHDPIVLCVGLWTGCDRHPPGPAPLSVEKLGQSFSICSFPMGELYVLLVSVCGCGCGWVHAHMCVKACGDLGQMSETIIYSSSSLSLKTGSLDQTTSSLGRPVSIANLIWGCPVSTF